MKQTVITTLVPLALTASTVSKTGNQYGRKTSELPLYNQHEYNTIKSINNGKCN